MNNNNITGLKEGTDNNDAVSFHQLTTGLSNEADTIKLDDYPKKIDPPQ